MVLSNPFSAIDFTALAQSMLFMDLSRTELEDVCRAGHTQRAARGSFFFMRGDSAEDFYILLAGRVKLAQVDADGQQVLLRAGGPYCLFGAVALGQSGVYPVSAEAVDECTALGWAKSGLMTLLDRYPRLAVNAIRVMAAHTQEFQEPFR
jgi:CRP/FNR family transcriptional regulator, nitrogen oxide reductase regulator